MADVPVCIKLYIVSIIGLILYNASVFALFYVVCIMDNVYSDIKPM
jgi:hypothetical protein